jgi:hypothetical protein
MTTATKQTRHSAIEYPDDDGEPMSDNTLKYDWMVLIEIRSPGNRPDEMERKFEFYETHGVEKYYVYDPDDGTLAGWLRK